MKMNFELFEKIIEDSGYGIVACNHFTLGDVRYLYCAILNAEKGRAYKAEGADSSAVFEELVLKIRSSSATMKEGI